jgi:hypothetical protein
MVEAMVYLTTKGDDRFDDKKGMVDLTTRDDVGLSNSYSFFLGKFYIRLY